MAVCQAAVRWSPAVHRTTPALPRHDLKRPLIGKTLLYRLDAITRARYGRPAVRTQAAISTHSFQSSQAAEQTPWIEALSLLLPLYPQTCLLTSSLALLQVLPLAPEWINWVLISPLILIMFVAPVVDALLGEFAIPEQDVANLDSSAIQRSYLRAVAFAATQSLAVFLAPAAAAAAWAAHGAASLGTMVSLVTCGMLICACAHGANHELLHSRTPLHQFLSTLMYAWELAWPYTRIHPHHHMHAGTPNDFTTARLNQSYYDYMPQYVSGCYALAWQLEAEKAQRAGRAVWSWKNGMVQGMALQCGILAWSVLTGGLPGLCWHVCSAVMGLAYLAAGDYLLHYGLTRVRMPDGSWSPFTHHNAFNSSFLLDNVLTHHVLRHSCHHLAPAKPSVALGCSPADLQQTGEIKCTGRSEYEAAVLGQADDRAPRLLPGYPLMAAVNLMFVPPLWFKYVNPLAEAANKAHGIAVGAPQQP